MTGPQLSSTIVALMFLTPRPVTGPLGTVEKDKKHYLNTCYTRILLLYEGLNPSDIKQVATCIDN